MGLFQKIKLLFTLKATWDKIKEAYKMDSSVKPGWKTSEFWITVVSNLVTVVATLKGVLPAQTSIISLAVLNAIYTVMRTLTKSVAPTPVAAVTVTTTGAS